MRIVIDIDLNEQSTEQLVRYLEATIRRTLDLQNWNPKVIDIKCFKEVGGTKVTKNAKS